MPIDSYGWETCPDSIIQKYLEKAKLFAKDDEAFKNFRRDPDYTKVLEGGAYEVGQMCLDRMLSKKQYGRITQELLKRFKENDIYGNPVINNFGTLGNIGPCTIRYMGVAFDIQDLLGSYKAKKIVEVGVGFGAMCKIFSSLYDFEEYTLVDLPDVINLCKSYLSNFPEISNKIKYVSCEDFEKVTWDKDIDLFISDSCIAECDITTELKYADKIMKNSKYAYITYNTLHLQSGKVNFERLMDNLKDTFYIGYELVDGSPYYISMKNKSIIA
jgi:putative sugar O-methyltransferase